MNKVRLFCGLALVLMLGCKHGSPIVGTWTATSPQGPVTMTYDADSKVKFSMSLPQASVTMDGTYTLKDNQLQTTLTAIDVKSTDPAKQAQMDQFEDFNDAYDAEAGQH